METPKFIFVKSKSFTPLYDYFLSINRPLTNSEYKVLSNYKQNIMLVKIQKKNKFTMLFLNHHGYYEKYI